MPKASVNGIDMYYEARGQGKPLILITGLGADHGSWFSQIPRFKKYYQVVTFDSRGIGKTEDPPEPYSLKTMADDAVSLMDILALDRAHILGQSLGGLVAQEIAINYPERVDKLILASTTTGEGSMDEAHPELMTAFGVKEGSNQIHARDIDVRRSASTMISLSFNKWYYRIIMLLLARFYMKPGAFDGMVGQLEAVAQHSTVDRLHMVQSPTLVITGTADRIVPPQSSEVIASRIPGARLVMVEGGSHAFHIEMRGRFNREVLDFLRDA